MATAPAPESSLLRRISLVLLVSTGLLGGQPGCGSEAAPPPGGDESTSLTPTGPCQATWTPVPDEGNPHVSPETELQPGSNPPASGPHYPTWARWGSHENAVPRGYYLHNLEHGGVALLYRCQESCDEVTAALEEVAASIEADPACEASIGRRIVITADPLLEVPVAAAAWDHVYHADCVDPTSLRAFILRHYDQAPESLCAQGEID